VMLRGAGETDRVVVVVVVCCRPVLGPSMCCAQKDEGKIKELERLTPRRARCNALAAEAACPSHTLCPRAPSCSLLSTRDVPCPAGAAAAAKKIRSPSLPTHQLARSGP
jgi:hypothetical protein